MNESDHPPAMVVTVKRILVPIDRSEYKEKIVAYAISLSKAWKAEMTVLHVLEPRHASPLIVCYIHVMIGRVIPIINTNWKESNRYCSNHRIRLSLFYTQKSAR